MVDLSSVEGHEPTASEESNQGPFRGRAKNEQLHKRTKLLCK